MCSGLSLKRVAADEITWGIAIEDMPETTSVWEWAVDEYGEEEVEAPVAWSRVSTKNTV